MIEIPFTCLVAYGIFCGIIGALLNETISIINCMYYENVYHEKKNKKYKQEDKECTA